MLVSIPHMGNLYIPLKALFKRLDVDFIVPPPTTQRTLSLGVKYSPEGLCIPFKLTLGNLIEVAGMGADTLIMPGGNGICRLGYYAKTQEQILNDLGYKIEMIQVGVSEQKLTGLMKIFKRISNNASWPEILSAFRFGLKKLNTLDNIERLVQKVRAIEIEKGTANQIYSKAIKAIDDADDYAALEKVESGYISQLNAVASNPDTKPLVIGIVGEFYVLLEPFSNFDIESELGKLGVEVRRTIFISDWTKFTLFLNPLGISEKEKVHRAARPYLKRDIGGDGWESIGERVIHNKEYDGLIHLAPFTCLPEIIAQNIMPTMKEDIPVLTIFCDEQMAKAGLLTRLEAFVDLLERKRRVNNTHLKLTRSN
jgi:predicted nucleotide-binding protein (sugar kinase/HSP70/actin superfamily)